MTNLFMSHASDWKSLVREVKGKLPEHFNVWIDETGMNAGDYLETVLQTTVSEKSDYFVLFVDEKSNNSKWVRKELDWALGVEQRTRRNFLLPVVLNDDAWKAIEPAELRGRRYISGQRRDKRGIEMLALDLADAVSKCMGEDINRLQNQVESFARQGQSDQNSRSMQSVSFDILKIIHNHSISNPITLRAVYDAISGKFLSKDMDFPEFRQWFNRVHREEDIFQGIYYDGEELFTSIMLHHAKGQVYTEEKRRIAMEALKIIQRHAAGSDRLVVTLDGGSTTGAIAALISKSVKSGMISNITVVTNSLPAALELALPNNNALRVHLAGGVVRPSSLAVVDSRNATENSLAKMLDQVGQVDLAFVGTSGISEDGLSTQTGEESRTKQTLLAEGAKHIIVTDPSKFGQRKNHIFASLENLQIITALEEGHGDVLLKYKEILEANGSKLSIV